MKQFAVFCFIVVAFALVFSANAALLGDGNPLENIGSIGGKEGSDNGIFDGLKNPIHKAFKNAIGSTELTVCACYKIWKQPNQSNKVYN